MGPPGALRARKETHEILYSFGDETYKREVILTNRWDYVDPYLEKQRKILWVINAGDKNPIKP